MAGARGLRATAQWGRQHASEVGAALGFTRTPPCFATIHYALRGLDIEAFENAILGWVRATADTPASIAVDGKTLRGSRNGEIPGVHLLAAFAGEFDAVLRQLQVDGKTNEAKTILALLDGLPVAGSTLTMDAAFTQREVCESIIDKGGDYIVTVKNNQPALRQMIEDMFVLERSPL